MVFAYAGLAVSPPDEAWVQNIAVRRDHQGRGLGRALLGTLLAEAGDRGARHVLLEAPLTIYGSTCPPARPPDHLSGIRGRGRQNLQDAGRKPASQA